MSYTRSYFESGISSVYMWDLEEGFAAAVLIKKGWSSLVIVRASTSHAAFTHPHGC
jgi:hypothetical protein